MTLTFQGHLKVIWSKFCWRNIWNTRRYPISSKAIPGLTPNVFNLCHTLSHLCTWPWRTNDLDNSRSFQGHLVIKTIWKTGGTHYLRELFLDWFQLMWSSYLTRWANSAQSWSRRINYHDLSMSFQGHLFTILLKKRSGTQESQEGTTYFRELIPGLTPTLHANSARINLEFRHRQYHS